MSEKLSGYEAIIERVFLERHTAGVFEVPFKRDDIEQAAIAIGVPVPKNLGDVVYSVRYRRQMPLRVQQAAEPGQEWIIEGAGRASYAFKQVKSARIIPNGLMRAVKIPDATPEIVGEHSLTDEQALLAKVRYNRLVDLFLGFPAYSLQNHLRTTVRGIGQIEIDELYVGVDQSGRQYIVPVQAKGGNDELSIIQTKQDIEFCKERYPRLIYRAVSAQFVSASRIALFELALDGAEVQLLTERHYRLVRSAEITDEDLASYRKDG